MTAGWVGRNRRWFRAWVVYGVAGAAWTEAGCGQGDGGYDCYRFGGDAFGELVMNRAK
jgi:hypothetical protein